MEKLQNNDRIIVEGLGGFFEGLTGKIIGPAYDQPNSMGYIILLDKPVEGNVQGIILPECYLRKI